MDIINWSSIPAFLNYHTDDKPSESVQVYDMAPKTNTFEEKTSSNIEINANNKDVISRKYVIYDKITSRILVSFPYLKIIPELIHWKHETIELVLMERISVHPLSS